MAGKADAVASVPCGNTVGLVGIDKYLTKSGTISNSEEAHCIKAMKYSVSPVVRVSVNAKNATDLPKLIEGLNKLSKSDPLVQCWREESGEHVIAGCGELHVEICLKDLAEFANIPIVQGEPVVAFRETVTEESSQVCCAKSKNKHNRIFATAQPLGDELTKAIEDDKITFDMDAKMRSKTIVEEFQWDVNEAKKIWCFGPDTSGPNLLVDVTSQTQYLNDVRDSIESSFNWVTKEGVLSEESMRGVRFNIQDVKIHSDNAHRGGDQIIPAARRVFCASQLSAEPRFQEPVFLVEIQCPDICKGTVYTIISQRRGEVIEESMIEGTPLVQMKAHLPVKESFGFAEVLRKGTKGRA